MSVPPFVMFPRVVSPRVVPPRMSFPPLAVNEWARELAPRWKTYGDGSSYTTVLEFAEACAETGTFPDEHHHSPVDTVARRTGLTLANAAVAVACIADTPERFFAAADGRASAAGSSVSVRDFYNPPPPATGRSYEEIAVAAAGAPELIGAELGVHSAVTIPQIVLITETLATIKQFSLNGDTQVANTSGLHTYVIMTYINYFVLLFSLVSSVVQVWISAYARLTDHAGASYLSAPRAVRFSDVGSFVLSLAIIEPIRMAILLYGEGGDGQSQLYFIAWISIAAIFVV
ncbi:unnamed protein product, partial [marine sediment metagenome]